MVGATLRPVVTVRVPISWRATASSAASLATGVTGIGPSRGGRTGCTTPPLAARLREDDTAPADVPAKLAARVLLPTGHGPQNDADADSVGIAASAADLSVEVDEAITALRAVVEHRDDLARPRMQAENRLHVLRCSSSRRCANQPHRRRGRGAAAPGSPRPRVHATLRTLAVDLVGEIGRLDTGIATADRRISTTVAAKPLWSMAEAASFDDDLGGRV